MANANNRSVNCCGPDALDGFQVEAVVSVDERGQMVLPKEVREKAGIRAGDKVAVVCLRKQGAVCCTLLIRAEAVADMVKGTLGPYMNELIK
jgi:antitoxin PrlF